jgi:siroheme synthase
VRRGLARRRRHARHDIELVLVDDLQRVVCGTLETLPLLAFKAGLTPPTLIIVGKVVQLRDGDVIHR